MQLWLLPMLPVYHRIEGEGGWWPEMCWPELVAYGGGVWVGIEGWGGGGGGEPPATVCLQLLIYTI